MAKSFSNPTFYNSGKPTFGNTFNTDDSGNYTRNKKAKLLYRHNYNGFHLGGILGSQNNYLLFQRAKVIRNETCASCPSLTSFNPSDLVAGLYTNEKLGGTSINGQRWSVNVITDVNFNIDASCNGFYPVAISTNSTPFYWKYKIDPCGALFGNAPCGYDNYEDWRVISKPVVTTASSLKDCCVPVCLTENILQENVCATVCTNNNNNVNPFSYTVTGSPDIFIINGFTVLTFKSSGSFQFLGAGKNIGYIVVGGGGAGGGSTDDTGCGGSGGTYSNPNYVSSDNYYISPGIYNVTVGTGGIGSNQNGSNGGDSSINGIITSTGGLGGQANGFQVSGIQIQINSFTTQISIPNININISMTNGNDANGSYTTPSDWTNQYLNNGTSATGYGCGGNGANAVVHYNNQNPNIVTTVPTIYTYSGGNGAPGVVIVWFKN